MTKQAQKIEVGLHEGRPGFTIEYTDGERVHFVFHKSIALKVADGLRRIVEDLDYVERQMKSVPADRLRVSDVARVRLCPPNGGSLGINSGDGVSLNDE